jgi:hypothetical protein
LEEESQVILYCGKITVVFRKIRYLVFYIFIDRTLDDVSKLIHFENITLFPEWTDIPYGNNTGLRWFFQD